LTISNEITVADNPSNNVFSVAGGGTLTFTVTITNPCWGAGNSIPQLVFSPA